MSVRRWASAGVIGLLGLGVGLHPATADSKSAASARSSESARTIGKAYQVADESLSWSGHTCVPAMKGAEPGTLQVAPNGVWRTIKLNRSGTVGSTTVRGTAAVRGRVSADARGTIQLGVEITSASSGRPAAASTCDFNGYDLNSAVVAEDVTVPRRSWLIVRSTATLRGVTYGVVGAALTGGSPDYFVDPGKSLTRLVDPGNYVLGSQILTTFEIPAQTTAAKSASAKLAGSVAFYPIGTRRAHSGAARRWVQVGHRNCTKNRVGAAVSSRARSEVRKIVLYVNGQRRAVLTGRELRQHVVALGRIDPKSSGKVRAVIVKKSGARRTMVADSWPCA